MSEGQENVSPEEGVLRNTSLLPLKVMPDPLERVRPSHLSNNGVKTRESAQLSKLLGGSWSVAELAGAWVQVLILPPHFIVTLSRFCFLSQREARIPTKGPTSAFSMVLPGWL